MSQTVMIMQAEMTTRPPITPPTIAPTGVLAPFADEVPFGTPLLVTLLIGVLVLLGILYVTKGGSEPCPKPTSE
jgi:hypothetical protein